MNTLKKFFVQTNLSLVSKICMAGLFIALAIILNKVIAINGLSFIPFLRISFGGCAVIILASLLLGPLFGAVVGAFSDIFGYLIFDLSGFPYFPQITLIYILLGILPSFIFGLIKNIKNKKLLLGLESGIMAALLVGLTIYFAYNNEITMYGNTYTIAIWMKWAIPILTFVLFGLIIVFTIFIDRHFKKTNKESPLNTYQVSFGCFLVELIVMVGFGSYIKASCFGMNTYLVILMCQCITMFFNVAINTFLVSYTLLIFKRYYPPKKVLENE